MAYDIPQFTPPDITPGASLLAQVLMGNRAADRADEYAAMERQAMRNSELRQSAEVKRKEEDDKRRQAIEAWAHRDQVFRDARKSPELGNMNPYGYSFDKQQAAAPSLRDSGINVMGGNEQYAQHAARAMLGQPAEQPQAIDPTLGQHSGAPTTPTGNYAGPSEETGEPPHDATAETGEGELSPNALAAQAFLGQPQSKKLFASYQGQRFEVPEETSTTGLGPDADTLYQNFLASGAFKTPQDAMKAVLSHTDKGLAETGRTTRSQNQIDARATAREDNQEFIALQNKLYKNEPLTNAERERLIALAGKYKVAAAGAEKPAAADNAEATILKTFLADFKDFRDRSAQAGLEVKSTRNINEIKHLAESNNPVDQALAVEQIGKIAHGGNTVTKATQDLIYHHMGGAFERGEAMLRQYTAHGTIAPDQLRYLRETANSLAAHHGENKAAIQQGFELQFGPNSAYGSPYLQPMARQHLDALYTEMGLQPGDVQAPSTEGSMRLGRQRGKKTGAPGARPPSGALTDDQAVQMARQRLANNPNDAIAKKVLQLHGLAQ